MESPEWWAVMQIFSILKFQDSTVHVSQCLLKSCWLLIMQLFLNWWMDLGGCFVHLGFWCWFYLTSCCLFFNTYYFMEIVVFMCMPPWGPFELLGRVCINKGAEIPSFHSSVVWEKKGIGNSSPWGRKTWCWGYWHYTCAESIGNRCTYDGSYSPRLPYSNISSIKAL